MKKAVKIIGRFQALTPVFAVVLLCTSGLPEASSQEQSKAFLYWEETLKAVELARECNRTFKGYGVLVQHFSSVEMKARAAAGNPNPEILMPHLEERLIQLYKDIGKEHWKKFCGQQLNVLKWKYR